MKVAFWEYDADRIVISEAEDTTDEVGILIFDHDACSWTVLSPLDGSSLKVIEIEEDVEQGFREQRQQIATQPAGLQPALEAELKGRVNAYRDETRDMAEIATRLHFRAV
jgi:hypothetical protein